jgi:hypothetical protein
MFDQNFDCRIIYFLAVALTSGALLAERNEGILERSLVSGITGKYLTEKY